MNQINRCPNLNHGKTHVSIKYCPMCGASFHSQPQGVCNDASHADQRKNRNNFCIKCGRKLSS